MQIQTITGSSIQAALAEARTRLGDDVVLLESVGATATEPARITVMIDPTRRVQPAAHAAPATAHASSASAAPEAAPLGFGYAAGRARRPGGAPLFTAPAAPPPAAAPDPRLLATLEELTARLTQMSGQMGAMSARMEAMEQALARGLDGPMGPWAGHPACADLRRLGFSDALVADLLGEVAGSGFHPDDHSTARLAELRWAVAAALRDRLAFTAPSRIAADALVAVGAGGSGKTALLLKLATNPRFYGRRRVAALLVAPEAGDAQTDDLGTVYARSLFRRLDVDAHTVRTADEVREALRAVQGADVVLVDTPALPAEPAVARWALERLDAVLAPLPSREVVLTVDAARAALPFPADAFAALPLAPTAAALTRMDECRTPGRVAEWLLGLGLPVPFVAAAAARTGALAAHSPGGFADTLVEHWEALRRASA